jgi:sugar phosphate isomerase/epimerase
MLFTFSSGSLPTYSLPAVFDTIKRAGADGIELVLSARMAHGDTTRARFLEDGFRLPIRSVHSVLRLRQTSDEQHAADILQSARFASELPSCRSLVVHPPDSLVRGAAAPVKWLDTIARAAEILGRTGVRVSVETPTLPTELTPDPRIARAEWFAMISQEWDIGVTLDTCHLASLGWDLMNEAVRILPSVDNVHLSNRGTRAYSRDLLNSLIRDHQPPARGELAIQQFLRKLKAEHYNGLITLEISPLRIPWYWMPAAERAMRDMIRYCRLCANGSSVRVSRSSRGNSRIDR